MKKLSDYQKIMQVIDAKGINQTEAEKLTDLGVGTIGKLAKRKDGFGSLHKDNVKKFLRTFKVNQNWWDKLEEPMFLEESATTASEANVIYQSADDLRKNIDDLRKNLEDLRKNLEDLRKHREDQDETIKAMEESDQAQDRLLDQYRQSLEECEKKLAKVKQAQ
jgi:chromosome segregation ATPase